MNIFNKHEELPESFKAYINAFRGAKNADEQKDVVKMFAGQRWCVEIPITAGEINDAGNYSTVKMDTLLGEVWVTFLELYPITGTARIMRVPSIEEFSRFGTPLITDMVEV